MHDDTELERIIRTARQNICDGVIQEPRIYYDEITIPEDGTPGFGLQDAFKNGEQYPVKIHWMTAAIGYLDSEGAVVDDERLIQRVRLRFNYHGADYMRRDFVRLPVWHNRPVAGPDAVAFGSSTFRPPQPFILSARDTLLVRVQNDDPGVTAQLTRPATFSITGYGLATRRPYFKATELDLTTANPVPLNPGPMRNDGDEPIVVTECGIHYGARSDDENPQGNIRPLRLSVRQIGNGTEGDWVVAPPTLSDLAPAVLWGTQTGRAIVHQWPPKDDPAANAGLLWEPGEGLQVAARGPAAGLTGGDSAILAIALVGTIVVT